MQRHHCIAAAAVTLAMLAGAGRQPTTTPAAKPKSPFGGSSFSVPTAPGTNPQTSPASAAPASESAGVVTINSGSRNGAVEVAETYFSDLVAGHPYKGVDDCFDAMAFAHRIFKADISRLDSSESAYLKQLTSVFIKNAATVNGSGPLRTAQHSEFKVTGEGDELRLTCTVTGTGEAPREMAFVVSHSGSGWKIVDINTVGSITTDAYNKVRAQSPSPVLFMEGMVGGLIRSKFEKMAPGSTQAGSSQQGLLDAQAGNLRAQLKSMMNQLELYKARTGHYPDLLAQGWQALIKDGYIKKAPVNPVNGSSAICAGTSGQANFGWYWDAKSGTLGACYYDETTMALTPDSP